MIRATLSSSPKVRMATSLTGSGVSAIGGVADGDDRRGRGPDGAGDDLADPSATAAASSPARAARAAGPGGRGGGRQRRRGRGRQNVVMPVFRRHADRDACRDHRPPLSPPRTRGRNGGYCQLAGDGPSSAGGTPPTPAMPPRCGRLGPMAVLASCCCSTPRCSGSASTSPSTGSSTSSTTSPRGGPACAPVAGGLSRPWPGPGGRRGVPAAAPDLGTPGRATSTELLALLTLVSVLRPAVSPWRRCCCSCSRSRG